MYLSFLFHFLLVPGVNNTSWSSCTVVVTQHCNRYENPKTTTVQTVRRCLYISSFQKPTGLVWTFKTDECHLPAVFGHPCSSLGFHPLFRVITVISPRRVFFDSSFTSFHHQGPWCSSYQVTSSSSDLRFLRPQSPFTVLPSTYVLTCVFLCRFVRVLGPSLCFGGIHIIEESYPHER